MSTELVPIADIERMATAIVKSNFFGVKTIEQAIALMLIAQAEGLHPAIAARDYHVISGRPTLKADTMLARFQAAGGSVEWKDYTDEKVSATFKHPQGGSVFVDWDLQRVAQAKIANDAMYKKYPRPMLRARCISEGIRTVYPGILSGMYTPEEVQGFGDKEPIQDAEVIEPEKKPEPAKQSALVDPFFAKCDDGKKWLASHGAPTAFTDLLGFYGCEKPQEVPADQRDKFLAKLREMMQIRQAEIKRIAAEKELGTAPGGDKSEEINF